MAEAPAPANASPPEDEALPELVAAVDLGSNSFHMKIARVVAGDLQVVDRLREMVRLASGLDAARHITEGAAERALACLARFGQRLRGPAPGERARGRNQHLPPGAGRGGVPRRGGERAGDIPSR